MFFTWHIPLYHQRFDILNHPRVLANCRLSGDIKFIKGRERNLPAKFARLILPRELVRAI